MGDQILTELVRSGILGALLVLALLVIRKLDTDLKTERHRNAEAEKAEQQRNAEAEKALLERMLAMRETVTTKMFEANTAMRELAESLSNKVRRPDDRRR